MVRVWTGLVVALIGQSCTSVSRRPPISPLFCPSKATLEDVTADAMQAVLEFIYTDRCTSLETRPNEILAAADKSVPSPSVSLILPCLSCSNSSV